LILYLLKTDSLEQRCGISVSKKVSKKAVVRNKLKRRIRSIYKNELINMKDGIDVIFVTRKKLLDMPFSSLKSVVINLIKKAKLYKEI